MKKGDVILAEFPFTNLQGRKRRPAIIVAVEAPDVTVAFVTSVLAHQQLYDVLLQPSTANGLKKPSLVRVVKLATLDPSMVNGKLGELSPTELAAIDEGMRQGFQLGTPLSGI